MPTVRNPESPFDGGVSQSNYSKDEAEYYAFLATTQALSDADLITAAQLAAAMISDPEERGELWVYNNELRRRGLPITQITA